MSSRNELTKAICSPGVGGLRAGNTVDPDLVGHIAKVLDALCGQRFVAHGGVSARVEKKGW